MVDLKNRSQEALKEDVKRLREWLEKQPHLPHDVEDQILTAFVCSTKTLEDAKRRLDNFYSARNRYPQMYDFQAWKETLAYMKKPNRAIEMYCLPKLTPDGTGVFIMNTTEDFDQTFDHFYEQQRIFMVMERGMYEWCKDRSFYVIFDSRYVSPSIATKLSAALLASALRLVQDSYPLKIKGLYFANAPSFAEMLVNTLVKPFLKEKLASRIKVTPNDLTEFKDHIPVEMLPSNFGGNEKSSTELNDDWVNMLEPNMDWLEQVCHQASDEKKRPPDSANTYGIDGTFRKLAVD